ncbi:unnamed protein product [Brassica oleracea]
MSLLHHFSSISPKLYVIIFAGNKLKMSLDYTHALSEAFCKHWKKSKKVVG